MSTASLNGSTPGAQTTARGGRSRWWVLVAMVFGLFMPMLDNLVVNVALPTIQRRLGAGISELQWIIDAYTLTFAAFMLTGGTLADHYGRKRLFLVGLSIFTLGSLTCGLSSGIHELIAFRALQGLGATMLLPGSLSILTATFAGRERGAAIGIWSASSGLAVAIGPLVGGFLVQHVGWQAIFFVNVPIGVLALALTVVVVPESRDTSRSRRLDPPGVLTGTLGLLALVYATIEGNTRGWTNGSILGAFALAAVLLGAFVWIEAHRASPMLPLGFFRVPTLAAAIGVAAAVFFALFGVTFFFSLYLQDIQGYSPIGAGVRLLPFTAMILLLAPLAGRLSDRFGSRWLMTGGTGLLAIGLALGLRLQVGSSYSSVILPSLMVMGAGMALTMSPMTAAVLGSVDPSRAGVASATEMTSQQVGGVAGVALLGAVVTGAFRQEFAAHLATTGLPHSVVSAILARTGASAVAGATPVHAAPPGTSVAVIAGVVAAARGSFVQALHRGLFVAVGITLLASLVSLIFVRSHVGRGPGPGQDVPPHDA